LVGTWIGGEGGRESENKRGKESGRESGKERKRETGRESGRGVKDRLNEEVESTFAGRVCEWLRK
jgi:hypothetical protein